VETRRQPAHIIKKVPADRSDRQESVGQKNCPRESSKDNVDTVAKNPQQREKRIDQKIRGDALREKGPLHTKMLRDTSPEGEVRKKARGRPRAIAAGRGGGTQTRLRHVTQKRDLDGSLTTNLTSDGQRLFLGVRADQPQKNEREECRVAGSKHTKKTTLPKRKHFGGKNRPVGPTAPRCCGGRGMFVRGKQHDEKNVNKILGRGGQRKSHGATR